MSKIIKKCYICTVEWVYFLSHFDRKYAQNDTQLRFCEKKQLHFCKKLKNKFIHTTKLLLN